MLHEKDHSRLEEGGTSWYEMKQMPTVDAKLYPYETLQFSH